MKKLQIFVFLSALFILPGCVLTKTGEQNVVSPTNFNEEQKVVSQIIMSGEVPDDCNQPDDFLDESNADYYVEMLSDGNYLLAGEPIYISAELAKAFDNKYEARWYTGTVESNPHSQDGFDTPGSIDRFVSEWQLFTSQENLASVQSCDGKYYLHLTVPSIESGFGVTGTWLAPRKVDILLDGEIVGEQSFYFSQ